MSNTPPPGPYGPPPPPQGPGQYGQPPQYSPPPQPPVYQQPYPGGPPQQWMQPPAPDKGPNPVGLAALICGIVACVSALFVPLLWLWLLTGFAAIVLGIIGLVLPGRRRALAIWGLSLAPGSLIFLLIGTTLTIAIGAATSVSEPDIEVSPPAVTEPSETPSAAPSEAPADTREPVTWEGEGELTTTKAFLEGDYAVAWETRGDCYYSADLDDDAFNEVFSASAATSGTSNVYDIEAGEHYLDVITGPAPNCGWTVTLTPQ